MQRGSGWNVHNPTLLLCRTKFAHLRYLRKNDLEDDIEENVVLYLIDAHELAMPDQDAKDVLAKAASAATTEIEAKKVWLDLAGDACT